MSTFIQDKAHEAAEEVARLDKLIAQLTIERAEAETVRQVFFDLLSTPVSKPSKPRRRARKSKETAPPPSPKDRKSVKLRVGSVAAREEERRKMRKGEIVPVDRVET